MESYRKVLGDTKGRGDKQEAGSSVKREQRVLGFETVERLSGEGCEELSDCCQWGREWVSGTLLHGGGPP